MKLNIYTLDGNNIDCKITSNINPTKSSLHSKARELLQAEFPYHSIMEEVYISIFSKKKLPFDFFIPKLGLFIEVQGEQHFKFIPLFHKTKIAFMKAKVRDTHKKEWCSLNKYRLVELLYNESIEEWKTKLYKIE